MRAMRSLSATGAFILSVVGGALLLALTVASIPAPVLAAGGSIDGKAVFLSSRCNLCHSVSTAGIESRGKAPDLVGLAADHDADWVKNVLRQKVELDGKKHIKPFTGSDEELAALVDWLLEQKK